MWLPSDIGVRFTVDRTIAASALFLRPAGDAEVIAQLELATARGKHSNKPRSFCAKNFREIHVPICPCACASRMGVARTAQVLDGRARTPCAPRRVPMYRDPPYLLPPVGEELLLHKSPDWKRRKPGHGSRWRIARRSRGAARRQWRVGDGLFGMIAVLAGLSSGGGGGPGIGNDATRLDGFCPASTAGLGAPLPLKGWTRTTGGGGCGGGSGWKEIGPPIAFITAIGTPCTSPSPGTQDWALSRTLVTFRPFTFAETRS